MHEMYIPEHTIHANNNAHVFNTRAYKHTPAGTRQPCTGEPECIAASVAGTWYIAEQAAAHTGPSAGDAAHTERAAAYIELAAERAGARTGPSAALASAFEPSAALESGQSAALAL